MANDAHLEILLQGVERWNQWRRKNPSEIPDLTGARLYGETIIDTAIMDHRDRDVHGLWILGPAADLRGIDLSHAALTRTRFVGADLTGASMVASHLSAADFRSAALTGANLAQSDLRFVIDVGEGCIVAGADFTHAHLGNADLTESVLLGVMFDDSHLDGTDFRRSVLGDTRFLNTDLSKARNLETCIFSRPTVIDHRTLLLSPRLPQQFLRGCGLPEAFIEYIPSIFGSAVEYYSCFISYSSKEQAFADRIYADLQRNGVRCWLASHDLSIGAKILDAIDTAIRARDRVLLVLSQNSIASEWVEDEVTAAFEEERRRGTTVLFPVRLDSAVFDASEPWAAKLRARNIGDFTGWEDPDRYVSAFERLLRDVKTHGQELSTQRDDCGAPTE